MKKLNELVNSLAQLHRKTEIFCFSIYYCLLVLSSNTKFALHNMAAVFTLMNNHIGIAAI